MAFNPCHDIRLGFEDVTAVPADADEDDDDGCPSSMPGARAPASLLWCGIGTSVGGMGRMKASCSTSFTAPSVWGCGVALPFLGPFVLRAAAACLDVI